MLNKLLSAPRLSLLTGIPIEPLTRASYASLALNTTNWQVPTRSRQSWRTRLKVYRRSLIGGARKGKSEIF